MNPLIYRSRTNRRRFLAGTGAALGAQWLPGCASLEGSTHGSIDAHVHVWTPDTAKYPLAEGFSSKDMKPSSFTPEELFAHCKPRGVDRVVLIQMSFYK